MTGGLVANFRSLEPFTTRDAQRELVVATANPEWTAVFDCGWWGSGPSKIAVLVGLLQVPGVKLTSARPRPGRGMKHRWGARQFWTYEPDPTGRPSVEHRAIDLCQDVGGWSFEANGEVLPFDDTDAYQRRRKTDRFTDQMLIDYAAALGLRAFDDDFYCGPSALISFPREVPPGMHQGTLEQVQEGDWDGSLRN